MCIGDMVRVHTINSVMKVFSGPASCRLAARETNVKGAHNPSAEIWERAGSDLGQRAFFMGGDGRDQAPADRPRYLGSLQA